MMEKVTWIDKKLLVDSADSYVLNQDASDIKALNAQIEALSENIKQMNAIKKDLEERKERKMQTLTKRLNDMGVKKYETNEYSLTVRNYKAKVILDDTSEIPAKYVKQEIKSVIDKQNLYNDLINGNVINGTHLEDVQRTKITDK